AHDFEPPINLAEEVRRALGGRQDAKPYQPFPMGGAINQGQQPKHARKVRKAFGDADQIFMREGDDVAGAERADGVVHLLEQETVQVNKVARQMNANQLTGAAGDKAITAGHATNDQYAAGRSVAFTDQIFPRGKLASLPRGVHARLLLLVPKLVAQPNPIKTRRQM